MSLSGKTGFIGAGKMAEALICALIGKNIIHAESICASDISAERLNHLKNETGLTAYSDNTDTVKNADIIFLSVKPQNFKDLLPEIKEYVTGEKLIISIAAGISTSFIENELNNARVIRVMPNTPCLVCEMAGAYCAGKYATKEDIYTAQRLLSSAGTVFFLEEHLIDAVTGLSGSGPAFVAYMIRAFIDAGQKLGLDKNIAGDLAVQTFLGTAKLLKEKELSPEELITMVKSPGGTTAAGLNILENSELENIIIKTIKKAEERSKELGKQ